jgi:hypothetical protein
MFVDLLALRDADARIRRVTGEGGARRRVGRGGVVARQ